MPGADGSVWIKIKADDEQAHKELVKLNKDIEKTEKSVESLGQKKMPLVEQAKQLGVELDNAKAKLANMQSGEEFFPKSTIKAQQAEVSALQKRWDGVNDKLDDVNKKIQSATDTLTKQKNEAGELQEKIASVSPSTKKMADAMLEAEKKTQAFAKRLKTLMRRVLVFSVFTMALRSMREWMGKVIKTNAEATAAMARLKGALLTLAQPLVNVIIPAFTSLVNVLSAVAGRVAYLVSALFGTTASESAEAAEALYKETEALEATGSAAKKAGKSLAAFDEINQISNSKDTSGSTNAPIAPDFSWADAMSDKMNQIADAVLLIGSGLALWKISKLLPETLGVFATRLAGIMVLIGGLILLWNGLSDAWENGVDWGNMAAMIAGVAAAAAGLWLVFGKVEAGIALVVSGIALLVVGFRDVINNGANLQNTLLIISGIIATGLGIFLITGSLIPLLIAGILSVITAIIAWQGNLEHFAEAFKMIFNGIKDFFVGIFTGDMERALKGLKNIFIGIMNALLFAFGSMINAIIDGLNWLIEKANGLLGKLGVEKTINPIKRVDLSAQKIPYLAQGAVIPPNREFLAVLGDQKSGTNIETPLSTMVDAFKQAINESGMSARGGGDVVLQIDGKAFARITNPYYKTENGRIGVQLVKGV